MKATIIRSHQNPPKIRKGSVRRDWMDDTYNKHAYKCLPLTEANTSGWEVSLQKEIVVQWDGGNTVPRVLNGEKMIFSVGDSTYERDIVMPSIIGIMSFTVGWVFKTDPGVWTWVGGAPNYFVDGAVPLNATIPSDWWPDEFNMNWKITKVGEPVTFPEGMPFMFFQFYRPSLLEEVEFEVENIWDYPDLNDQRMSYNNEKMQKIREQPWTWMGGIRTGLNEKDEQIGPKHQGHLNLKEPN